MAANAGPDRDLELLARHPGLTITTYRANSATGKAVTEPVERHLEPGAVIQHDTWPPCCCGSPTCPDGNR